MAVSDFTTAMQSEAYKNWFNSLEKNIISSTVDKLRTSQQKAEKTDFLITAKDIRSILTSVLGHADETDIQAMINKIADNSGIKGVKGSIEVINGQKAVLYKGIGFDTITKVLNRAFSGEDFDYYLHRQTELYKERAFEELKNDPTLTKQEYKREWQKIDAMPDFTIGTFFDKGHVVSIATNLTKAFRDEINNSNALADRIKKTLIQALDVYIKKLEEDDLATANLPKELYQSIGGVDYTKSSETYLVEMQYSIINRASGTASKEIVEELRKVFTPNSRELEKVFSNSSTGRMLVESESSPNILDIIAMDMASVLSTGKRMKKAYGGKLPKPIEKKVPLAIKTKSNKKLIADAKKLKDKINRVKPKTIKAQPALPDISSLQNLLNASLHERIKQNMGTGSRRDVLNYRTGRFAKSVTVERLTQSREGMVTAFYTYMKNPYATFSAGGSQEVPRSRDPKLLISRSIREIGAQLAYNRMRAVLV